MKQKFKLILLLLSVITLVLVGCRKKTTPITEFNALGNWKAGSEGVYTITTNTTENLSFNYDKGTHVSAKLESGAITQDLSGLKKLVLEIKGVGSISLQLVNKTNVTKEVRINVVANKGSYEWNLIDESEFLKTISKIVIVASPDKEKSTGNVEITELKFYDTNADNFIIQTGYDNIPSNENEYDGVSQEFSFNDKWGVGLEADEGVYTVTKQGEITKVSFDKGVGKEWAYIHTRVKGELKKFNYVVVTLKGTKDQTVIVKAMNGVEKRGKFTDDEITVVVDISKLTDAEKNAINSILIFGLPGATGKGSFDIISAKMVVTYDIEEEIISNKYNGTDQEFSLINWYDNGDFIYEITNSETDTEVKYNKTGDVHHWSNAAIFFEGDISKFEVLKLVVTGQVGKKAMFKVEGGGGNIETPVEFDGTKQTIKVYLDKMTKDQLKAANKVILFAAPGGIGSGTITIHSTTFAMDDVNHNIGWTDSGDEVYEITENVDRTVTVAYKKSTFEWANLKKEFDTELERYNTVTLTFRGTAGKDILVKLNNKIEKIVTFGESDLVVSITDDKLESILLFVEPGTANVEGIFTIVSISYSYVEKAPVAPTEEVNLNIDWVSNDKDVYTFTEKQNGIIEVSYNKSTNHSWAFFIKEISQNLANHNTIVLKLKGTAGKKILVKPNDKNYLETTVTFDGTEQTIKIPLTEALTKMLIFVEPDVADVTGSFEIISATVIYEMKPEGVNTNVGWVDNGDGVYTFSTQEDVVTVSYNKQNHSWALFKTEFDIPLFYYNTLTLVVKGEAGKKILVKPNDDGSLEQFITFDGNEQTFTFNLTKQLTKVLIFAEPDTIEVSGSFKIISSTLTYVKKEVNVNVGWTANNDTIYQFESIDNGIKISYDRAANQAWEFIKTTFTGYTKDKSTLKITVNGTSGNQLIIKPNDNSAFEKTVDLTGEDQLIEFNLTDIPKNILIFVDPIKGSLTGSFIIKSLTLN